MAGDGLVFDLEDQGRVENRNVGPEADPELSGSRGGEFDIGEAEGQ